MELRERTTATLLIAIFMISAIVATASAQEEYTKITFQYIAKGSGEMNVDFGDEFSVESFEGMLVLSGSSEIDHAWTDGDYAGYDIIYNTVKVRGRILIKWTSDDGTKYKIQLLPQGGPNWDTEYGAVHTFRNELSEIAIPVSARVRNFMIDNVKQEVSEARIWLRAEPGNYINVRFNVQVNECWLYCELSLNSEEADVFKINTKLE